MAGPVITGADFTLSLDPFCAFGDESDESGVGADNFARSRLFQHTLICHRLGTGSIGGCLGRMAVIGFVT